ncbi:MAG: hypothetical protein KC636_39195 [Myxococcales bacterium]|nr:hypothetical protein [Myxococcales bacterium]
MRDGPDLGLRRVPTEALQTMLRQLHRGQLACPITPVALAGLGLQDLSESIMNGLRGLDAAGVRAVLVAVLGERTPR